MRKTDSMGRLKKENRLSTVAMSQIHCLVYLGRLSSHTSTQYGVWRHWWFHFPPPPPASC